MRQHDLKGDMRRPLTEAEVKRVVDRTGEIWREKSAKDLSIEDGRAFLIVGPPVVYSIKRKNGRVYANHPVVDFPGLNERFYRSEDVDELNKNNWSYHYTRIQ